MIFEVGLATETACHQNLQPAYALYQVGRVVDAYNFAIAEIRRNFERCDLEEGDWLLLATLSSACGFQIRAAAFIKLGLRYCPDSKLLGAQRAFDLAAKGHYFEAKERLDSMLQITDKSDLIYPQLLALQAYNFSAMRWDTTAAELHADAAKVADDNPIVWYILSRASAQRTNWKKSVEEGRKTLSLCASWSRARASLGDSLLSMGDPKNAKMVLEVNSTPHSRLDFLRAMCWQAMGETRQAIAKLAELVETWPSHTRLVKYSVRQLVPLLLQEGFADSAQLVAEEFGLDEFRVQNDSETNRRKYFSMPLVSQTRNHCVPTLAAMVAGCQGVKASAKEFADGMQTRNGTPLWRMVSFMESLGFRAVCVRPEVEIVRAMLEQNIPLVGELTNVFNGHVDAVCGYDERLEVFYLRDPMHWHGSTIKFDELTKRYEGSASLWAFVAPSEIENFECEPEWENHEGQALIELAKACSQGNRKEAEAAFDRIPDESNLAFARNSIARLVVLTGSEYQKRLEKVVENAKTEDGLVERFQIRALLQMIDEDNADMVLKLAKENKEHFSHTFVRYVESQCLLAKNQWQEALEAFEWITRKWPSMDSLWSQLSQVQQQLGMADEARKSLEIAIEVAPDHGQHRSSNLVDRESDIDFHDRLAWAKSLIEEFPDSPSTRITLARVMTDCGNGKDYEKAFKEVVRYFPRYHWGYHSLAKWYLGMGREDLAKAILNEARDLMGTQEVPLWTFEIEAQKAEAEILDRQKAEAEFESQMNAEYGCDSTSESEGESTQAGSELEANGPTSNLEFDSDITIVGGDDDFEIDERFQSENLAEMFRNSEEAPVLNEYELEEQAEPCETEICETEIAQQEIVQQENLEGNEPSMPTETNAGIVVGSEDVEEELSSELSEKRGYFENWKVANDNHGLPHVDFEELGSVQKLVQMDKDRQLHWWQSERVLSLRVTNLLNDQTVLFNRKNTHRAIELGKVLPKTVPGIAECYVQEFLEAFPYEDCPRNCLQVLLDWVDSLTPNRDDYAQLCFQRAFLLEQMACFNESEDQLKQIVHQHRAHYASYYRLGQIELRRGDLKSAKTYFDQCLSVAPGNHGAIDSLIKIAEQHGESTLELNVRRWQLQPYSHTFLYEVAMQYCAAHGPEAAHRFIREQRDCFEDDRYPVIQARVFVETGQPDQALDIINSMPGDQLDYAAEWIRVDCAIAQNNFDEVIEQVAKMQRVWPTDSELVDQMARALREIDEEQAKSYAAQKLREGYHLPLLAFVYLSNEILPDDLAKSLLKRAELNNRDALATVLIQALEQCGTTKQSIQFMEFCSERLPHLRIVRFKLAKLLYQAGEIPRAIQVAQGLVDDEPENPDFLECVGQCLKEQNATKAIEHLEKSYLITGKTNTLAEIALIHQKNGDHEKAQQVYKQALSLDPGNTLALTNLHNEYKEQSPEFLELVFKAFENNASNFDVEMFLVMAVELAQQHKQHLPLAWLGHALRRAKKIQRLGGVRTEGSKLGAFIEIWIDQWKLSEDRTYEPQGRGQRASWVPNKPVNFVYPELAGEDGLLALDIALNISSPLPGHFAQRKKFNSIENVVKSGEACMSRRRWDEAEKHFWTAVEQFDETVGATERQIVVRRLLDAQKRGSLLDHLTRVIEMTPFEEKTSLFTGIVLFSFVALVGMVGHTIFGLSMPFMLAYIAFPVFIVAPMTYLGIRNRQSKRMMEDIKLKSQIKRQVRGLKSHTKVISKFHEQVTISRREEALKRESAELQIKQQQPPQEAEEVEEAVLLERPAIVSVLDNLDMFDIDLSDD